MKLKLLIASGLIAATSINAATWKYAFGEGLNDPQGIYASAFKEFIEDSSRHKIELYKVGSLGEEADMMEQAKGGLLHFIGQSTGYMEQFLKWMFLLCLMFCQQTQNNLIIFLKIQKL